MHRRQPDALTSGDGSGEPRRITRVLRILAGERASVWTAALADLRGQAGRVGFHIVGVPEASDSALDQAGDVLLIELRGTESENLAYQLKAAFTRARAANDKTTLVLAASDSTLQSLRDDLAAYVDAFLILGQSDAAGPQRQQPTVDRRSGGGRH